MTPADLLNIAAAQIAQVPGNAHGYYGLYVTNKQLHCQPVKNRETIDLEVIRFLPGTVTHGMISSDWNKLQFKLTELQQEGLL